MFNDSYFRACMKLQIVQKIRFSHLESGRTKAWCPGLVSRQSAKAQEPVARSRGLVIQPQNTQLVHILSFHSKAVVSLFIFPTSPTALDSYLRACMKLRIVQKIRFSLHESGRTKKQRACYLAPKTLSWCIFSAFVPRVWFPNSSFQQVRQPSIPSLVEEDTPKIRDTTGTVFIQVPYIVLLVWRSIMFNGPT